MALRIITNVPPAELDDVVQMLKDSGATSVTSEPEGDGEFRVTGVFPDIEKHKSLASRLGRQAADD